MVSRRVLAGGATIAAVLIGLFAPATRVGAQSSPRYLVPPKAIVDILDAAPLPGIVVSPARDRAVLLERRSMPTIRDLAQPTLRLAGTRINPNNYAPSRSTNIVALSTVVLASGATVRIEMPAGTTAMPIGFDKAGGRFAYGVIAENRTALWMLDTATGRAHEITGVSLNATFGAPCDWLPDGRSLVCTLAVELPSNPPAPAAVPVGPSIEENAGRATPAPTYQDLLRSDRDEALFEYCFTSRLALVDAESGAQRALGTPGLYERVDVSPNGEYLLVSQLKRPYSRTVPYDDFAKDVAVWNRQGTPVKALASLPVADNVPIGGVPTGLREARWNAFAPSTVVWVEALDGGDTRRDAKERDRVLTWNAPFSGTPKEVARTTFRFQSLAWTDQGAALLTEFDRRTRSVRAWAIDDEGATPRKLWDRNADDGYADPGQPVQRVGTPLVIQTGNTVFLRGDGASPTGDHPFLSRYDLRTGAATRVMQSSDGSYEQVVAVLTDDGSRLLTRLESRTEPPNYYVREGSQRRALSHLQNPAPQLAGVQKERLAYTRKDGVQLSATLYLPAGHRPGEKHPLLLWAYPREFGDSATAGQVRGSLDRFTIPTGPSHLLLLTQGYAILDDPTMPIVGEGETANDTYVEQLVASAEAAVDKVVAMGVADRDRIGVGGHSYGAFMTANLLAHSDLFRAGIARSGAYNRTLTAFGFQNERRTFWEIPGIYAKMSPFWFADRIKEPVLLIHGEADDNTGTFPLQSERFYAALKGHGATVRYVTLPLEAHGYLARESVLHTVAEMLMWMETYVKNAGPRPSTTSSAVR